MTTERTVEVRVGGDREVGGGGGGDGQHLKKIRGLATLYQLCEENLKISNPPIIKPPPPIPGSTHHF